LARHDASAAVMTNKMRGRHLDACVARTATAREAAAAQQPLAQQAQVEILQRTKYGARGGERRAVALPDEVDEHGQLEPSCCAGLHGEQLAAVHPGVLDFVGAPLSSPRQPLGCD